MGFHEGKNIILTAPDDKIKVDKWLKNNEEMSNLVRKLVFQNQIFEERLKYINISFKKILSSRFNGSFWSKGKYYFY